MFRRGLKLDTSSSEFSYGPVESVDDLNMDEAWSSVSYTDKVTLEERIEIKEKLKEHKKT